MAFDCVECGTWTCPGRPATSLPDGEAEAQSGKELTPGRAELVPEAAPKQ